LETGVKLHPHNVSAPAAICGRSKECVFIQSSLKFLIGEWRSGAPVAQEKNEDQACDEAADMGHISHTVAAAAVRISFIMGTSLRRQDSITGSRRLSTRRVFSNCIGHQNRSRHLVGQNHFLQIVLAQYPITTSKVAMRSLKMKVLHMLV